MLNTYHWRDSKITKFVLIKLVFTFSWRFLLNMDRTINISTFLYYFVSQLLHKKQDCKICGKLCFCFGLMGSLELFILFALKLCLVTANKIFKVSLVQKFKFRNQKLKLNTRNSRNILLTCTGTACFYFYKNGILCNRLIQMFWTDWLLLLYFLLSFVLPLTDRVLYSLPFTRFHFSKLCTYTQLRPKLQLLRCAQS